MMKKLLLLLGVLLITTGSAFALSSPRWSFFPVNVYIQHDGKNAANAQIVQNAFKTWQSNSNYILKFLYKNSSGYAKNAQIRVKFADNIPEGGYYYINDMTMSKSFRNQYVRGFYMYVDIIIRTKEADGSKISKKKLQAIAMQAVGRAVGVRCISDENSVMNCNSDFSKTTLTSKDIEALRQVYKYKYKSVKSKRK